MKPLAFAFLIGTLALTTSCKKPSTRVPAQPNPSRMGFVDLLPLTELRLLNAYFKEGSQHELSDYTGTQTARFQAMPSRGLRLLSVESLLPELPKDQIRTSDLVPTFMRRYKNYRYFYAVVFANRGRGQTGSAVLLGSNSVAGIEDISEQMKAKPEAVCSATARNCIVFPQTCTVSVEIAVTVNGGPQSVAWGVRVGNVAPAGKRVRLTRVVNGRDVLTEIEPANASGRGTVVLPGDRLQWQ